LPKSGHRMMIASLLETIDEFFGTFYPGCGHE